MRDSLRLQAAFLSSGAAALLFEVLWFRALGRVVGNTVWAAALVLTAFMLGIGLGGFLAARWAKRIRDPARGFALAEAAVAISGSLLVLGLPFLEAPFGRWLSPLVEHPTAMATLRLALALAAMLVPTIAMGVTLPLGVRALGAQDTTRILGRLYAANTFGACLAPMFAEIYLLEWLGLSGTALAASLLNLVAASLAWRMRTAAAGTASPQDSAPWHPRLLGAAALAGAAALGLEVVWFRLLLLHAPATDATFALLLFLMLVGIGLGGLLASRLRRVHMAWVAAASALAVVLGYLLSTPVQGRGGDILRYAALLMLPAAIASGTLFTLLGAALRGPLENPQPAIGRLTFANTLGAALGAALTGFVLLPGLGVEKSLFCLAAGYALLALVLVRSWREAGKPALAVGVAVLALFAFPFGTIERHLAGASAIYRALDGSSAVQTNQGPTTTLQVLRTERFGEASAWRLMSDSYSMTGIDKEALRYMQLFAWLPLALHPEPRRALLISYGAGNTARALLDDPTLESLTVVDTSPEILAASRLLHGGQDPLADSRVRVVVEDGRHFLRTRREQFDIITAEPPPPMMAGVVNLYSREYFAALAARLAPGGLATYWLPVRQFEPRGAKAVIAAFCTAFPDCTLWAGVEYHWLLMGGRDFDSRPATQHFARLWQRDTSAERLEASGFEHPAQLGATFLADAGELSLWIGRTPPVTDDHPKRMATDPPSDMPMDEYLHWLDPASAERNFAASRWVAAHWPADFLQVTIQFFRVQRVLNGQIPADPVERLVLLDTLLRDTRLGIPVLWTMGTDMREQEILDHRLAEKEMRPEYAYPLGARALAQRDYRKAADLLAKAAGHDPQQAGAYAAYAACRAGLPARAAAVQGSDYLPRKMRCW